MTRKLFSALLSAFALLLLMGAAVPEEGSALLAEEESSIDTQQMELETEALSAENGIEDSVRAAASDHPLDVAATTDDTLLIDGVSAPSDLGKFQQDGVTYVALAPMAKLLDPTAQVDWNGSTATVKAAGLSMTATVGQHYLVANGRYLYLDGGVKVVADRVTVPLWAVAKAFGASLSWDGSTGVTRLVRGSSPISSGDSYYDQEKLFWLSRVIQAESGNQPLEGKMAVGNVIMNRVESPYYPDTIQGVLAQKNQFTTWDGGALANKKPSEASVIAAKLVLDGGEVDKTEGALYFDSASRSWASRNRPYVATIGGHKFYG